MPPGDASALQRSRPQNGPGTHGACSGRLAEFDFGDLEVTPEILAQIGLIKKPNDPVVILGDGDINVPMTVKAHRFSKSAREKIEGAGGSVQILPLKK